MVPILQTHLAALVIVENTATEDAKMLLEKQRGGGGGCSDMDELVNLATLLFESIQLHYFDKK